MNIEPINGIRAESQDFEIGPYPAMSHKTPGPVVTAGIPALVGGFSAAATAGLAFLPAATVGLGACAAYSFIRWANQK
jgi:hypothetical protein